MSVSRPAKRRFTTAVLFLSLLLAAALLPAQAQGPCAAAPAPTPPKNLNGLHGAMPPAYLGFVPGLVSVVGSEYYDWNEQSFAQAEGKPDINVRGKYWRFAGDLADGCKDRAQAWAQVQAAFIKAGWQLVRQWSNSDWTLHYAGGATEAWVNVDIREPRVEVQAIEAGPVPLHLSMARPAAQPETVTPAKGDFPYLTPLPGSKLQGGRHEDSPLIIKHADAQPDDLVAPGFVYKSYEAPDGLTPLEFVTVYHEALNNTGWTIARETHSADAMIYAHYGENGRNLWVVIHASGGGYSFQVGDENKLDADLKKDCHVALSGVLFDFNKATLKPESDAVLQRVLALLKDPALKLEIQGHTDNVGDDKYNQTLSEQRAAAVVAWLTQHGVAADRLSARGYGKTMPVADNKSDEGRTRNRRVEIANPACNGKGT